MISLRVSLISLSLLLVLGTLSVPAVSAATLVIRDDAGDVVQRLSDEELASLPQSTFETTTPWTTGPSAFQGPTLASVLGDIDPAPVGITLRALNDYEVAFPVSAMTEHSPIVAFLRNGERMTVREKGPYWVMFPFDSNPELQQERFYSLSVWQLKEIVIQRQQ